MLQWVMIASPVVVGIFVAIVFGIAIGLATGRKLSQKAYKAGYILENYLLLCVIGISFGVPFSLWLFYESLHNLVWYQILYPRAMILGLAGMIVATAAYLFGAFLGERFFCCEGQQT